METHGNNSQDYIGEHMMKKYAGKKRVYTLLRTRKAGRNAQETNYPGEENKAGKFSGKTQGTHGRAKETHWGTHC